MRRARGSAVIGSRVARHRPAPAAARVTGTDVGHAACDRGAAVEAARILQHTLLHGDAPSHAESTVVAACRTFHAAIEPAACIGFVTDDSTDPVGLEAWSPLARLARSGGAARAGPRRGRTPRLSRVRTALLRIRPRGLHDVPHGLRRGLLLQGPRRLPVLQRPPHGPDGRAPCRSRHPTGARAAAGDLRAEAAAGLARRSPCGRRRPHEDLS